MDWADDVAYSVHDLEDGVEAGHIDLRRLDLDAVAALAAEHYSDGSAGDLEKVLRDLVAEPWWPRAFDGTAQDLAVLKRATSTLIGRFCSAAEHATRAEYGHTDLTRYAADLVVPERVRAECALLKAVTALYVMRRPEAHAIQQREREVVAELVQRLAARAPEALDPYFAEQWAAAGDDGARLRVVVDQVAGLTDAAAISLLARLS
jgi:dGTPase